MKVRESIQNKLRRVVLLTTGAVLLLTVATFVTYEVIQFRRGYLESLSTVANITAENVTSSLAFRDPADAQDLMNALAAEPTVRLAVLYDLNQQVFAFYPANTPTNDLPAGPGLDRAGYEKGTLVIVTPSTQRGDRKGTLYMVGTLTPLYQRLGVYATIVVLVLLSSFLLAYLLAAWMQKRFTNPILELAQVAAVISNQKDFSVRATTRTDDEIGGSTEAFNEMLNQIAKQDAALRQNAERLRLALEASQTGTWSWDLDSKRVVLDEHLQRLLGLKAGDFAGTYDAFLEIVHPDDRPAMDRVLKRAVDKRKDFSIDFRTVLGDGAIRHMSTRGRALEDDKGAPVRMTGVTIDVTESKKAEQAIRESEERFRSMAEAAPVMIWTAGVNRGSEYFNRLWLEFTGRSLEQELGYGWTEGIYPDDREHCLRTYKEAFDAKREFEVQYRLRRHDGEYRWVRDRGIPRFAPDGGFRGFIGSVLDVTDIRQSQMELEQRVEARTAELAETNRELEAFTYSVSHDLRAPLRHINAYAQILEEDYAKQLDPAATAYLTRIRAGAKNMGMLVDDLLNLARVGRQELAVHRVDLNSLVAAIISDITEEIQDRKIIWRFGDLGWADCDPGLIKQVFTNLISNAVKYTRPRAEAEIEIGLKAGPAGTAYFVKDNGVGFNMKYASKLFGVFQRLHRPEEFEGTGVGLATVERIIRKHGGTIWAEAELDKGATFYFTLPRRTTEPGHSPENDSGDRDAT